MKVFKLIAFSFLLFAATSSCNDEEEIDKQKPEIDLTLGNTFPRNCSTLYFGESFTLTMLFSDNVELGSYSIDIHHNFDHHSHSTEVTECDVDPVKSPVNPFTLIEDFSIPVKKQEFQTQQEITIPIGNSQGLYEEGDYHFFISLTDKEGWSAQKGLSIKLLHRK